MRIFCLIFLLEFSLCGAWSPGSRADEPAQSEQETPAPSQKEVVSPVVDEEWYYYVNTRDNRAGIREEEVPAYYYLLDYASRVPLHSLKPAAWDFQRERRKAYPQLPDDVEFPAFVDLFKNPELYQGQPVTLTGWSRKIVEYPATENDYGIETLYEIWLYTDDSQHNPAVVVCTALPEGIPMGNDMVEGIVITGYFFKLFAYQAQDASRVAPMILVGNQVQWTPSDRSKLELPTWMVALIIALPVLLVIAFWRIMRRERKESRQFQERIQEPEPDFRNLTSENETQSPSSE